MLNAFVAPLLSSERMNELNDFFFGGGNYSPPPAAELLKIPQEELAVFCNRRAIYGLPTQELIEFLKSEIGKQKAIEIGAGAGLLGCNLGIPMTDSKQQERSDVKLYYKMTGQPTITYHQEVREFDALEAVRRFKPGVVIGSWITERWIEGKTEGNMYGVKEDKLLTMVEKYILIGHENTHGRKEILKHKHRIIKEPWICSRALDREKNLIYIWDNN